MLRTVLALGLASLATGGGAPAVDGRVAEAARAAGDPFAGMPDLEIAYYDVAGRTAAQIRASLDRRRRADPETGIGYDGYTAWQLDWWIPGSPEGPCELDKAEVTIDVTVGLPRLVGTDRVLPEVLDQWQRYMTAMKAHEAIHARNAYQGRKAVLRAIHGAECATANQAARDARNALERQNDEYDRVTQHGLTEGVHFP